MPTLVHYLKNNQLCFVLRVTPPPLDEKYQLDSVPFSLYPQSGQWVLEAVHSFAEMTNEKPMLMHVSLLPLTVIKHSNRHL